MQAARQERRRQKSAIRSKKDAEINACVSALPPKWQRWVKKDGKPMSNFVSANIRKLVVQSKMRADMERRIITKLTEAKRAFAVLNKVFVVTRDSGLLIVVTDDPNYRSNLTSFTLEHATVQTMVLYHYYRELLQSLEKELEMIAGPWGTVGKCNPTKRAADLAMSFGVVSKRTVYYWHADFEHNGHRFSESIVGKAIHCWILENPTMKGQAKRWL